MTRTEFQIVEMLGGVIAFCEANHDKFLAISLIWVALKKIQTAVSKVYEMAALQDPRGVRLSTTARQIARDALSVMLDTIHQTSLAVALDVPQAETLFRMPGYPRRDGDLIEAGEQFAKDVEPLKAAFIDHHMPEDFIEQLKEAVQNFQQAIDKQRLAKNDRTRASAQISASVADALMSLKRVDSIVKNTLNDDPAGLTAWENVRRVNKVRKLRGAKPEEFKPGAAVPIPAPAGEEAAPPPAS